MSRDITYTIICDNTNPKVLVFNLILCNYTSYDMIEHILLHNTA